jgi:large repetitive protein
METQSNVKLFENFRKSATNFVAMVFCLFGAVAATAGPLVINVVGVKADGTQIPISSNYRWTVEEDATKLSVPGRPATTANYSFSFHTSYMPVVSAGRVGTALAGAMADPDVAALYAQTPPEVCSTTTTATCLVSEKDTTGQPLKRYYVSVAADGFQMGGAPVVFSSTGDATAKVYVNQYPLPTAQVSVFAFNDNSPLNGAIDLPQETGLAGFTVQLYEAGGTYGQSGGEVTQDGFGNPLGTKYNDDGSVKTKGAGIVLTGRDGTAIINNLFPAKYTVVISPPVNTDWHQTSTIEGTRGSDAWVKNNEPSFFQEFGPPGHHVFIGFTRSGCIQGPAAGAANAGRCNGLSGDGTSYNVTGRIINIHNSRTPNYAFEKGAPVPECWVGLNETGGGTRALYAIPCNKDSTFTIPKVPNGTYQLVAWDDPLDMIIGTQTITVNGVDLAMGDVPVFSWFGRYQGRVFQDIDGTGLPFFAEDFDKPYVRVNPVTGVETLDTKKYIAGDLKPAFGEGIASNIRFRDGSIYQSATTKADGTFAFTELFPFFNWMIAEIDYARFKVTGATMVADAGGVIDATANATKLWNAETGSYGSSDTSFAYNPWTRLNPQLQGTCDAAAVAANLDSATGKIIDATACFKVGDKYYRTEQGVILLEGMQTFLGQTNHIEWGKQPYSGELNGPKNENGGIAGIVHYSITRAEDDPRFATAENWEPGIPRVQIGLYLDCDGDGKIDKPANNGTGQCAAGGLSGANGYVADMADVDNYPFCWRDPESCGLAPGAGQKGPEDIKRSSSGLATEYSFGDVFRWGAPGGSATDQLHAGLGKTDSWDDSLPTGCIKPAAGAVGNGGIPFAADLDCFDGLYNFQQLRPSVFDGGYAFGRVAGQAELPVFIGAAGKGTYIVEAKAPPGYLHQGNGDKNVTFGDTLQASTAALPFECVGMELDVPAQLTLFADGTPDTANPNYSTGAKWRKCDMKAVPLVPGTNPAPDFHMFTEAPVAGHGVGFILDDTATEFNRFSPSFGEKYAPPHLPVSVQDWAGREISRVYSDQFGSYNFLVPSSFTINPPFPSGVMPSMMVSCMNHPGPITDERPFKADGTTPNPTFGQKIIDPFFNRKYTQFCYTLQYLAGKTTYLDTPVLPIAAFASVEKNPLDCECQDKTPAIYSANNADGGNKGPWVSTSGGALTIVSAGSAFEVVNPAYDPTLVGSPKLITRDYSFGAGGTVKLGNVVLAPTMWSEDLITLPVPGTIPVGAHQLTITRADSGKETVVGITVHVGGDAPITVAPGASIQAVIDAASTPMGALITIPPGTYNEYLILDKRVRLQGWGAYSVGINASKASAGGLAAWRTLLNKKVDARCSLADGVTADLVSDPLLGCPGSPIDADTGGPTLVAGPNRTFDPLPGQTLGINKPNNEPILFGAEEGAGILALGKASGNNGNPCANAGLAYRIDGLTLTGSDSGGGILASGYNCNLQITNNRVVANYGTYGGGIRVGHTSLVNDTTYTSGLNNNVVIDHNWISQNGASEIASGDGGGGGITMGTGSNAYAISNNYVCGNFSMSDGGGISHVGMSSGTNNILNNKILLNQTFNQSADPTGGGLFIGGQIPVGAGATAGTGTVHVDRNLIQYNHAGAGAGGGVSIVRTAASNVVLTNNMIVNNATAYAGGGVSVADVSNRVRLVNNTVANNTSTATNRQSFAPGDKNNSVAQIAGIARVSGASPTLLNNIVWGNQSFVWHISATESMTLTPAASPIWDLGVVGDPSHTLLASTYSVLTANAGNATGGATTNIAATAAQVGFVKPVATVWGVDPDQPGVLPETTIMTGGLTFDEGGNFINVVFSPLTPWDISAAPSFGSPRADYHITTGSVAVNGGAPIGTPGVPAKDYDGDSRSPTGPVDIGADELPGPPSDLGVTVTDNQTLAGRGLRVDYTIVVSNNSGNAVTGAVVNNAVPVVQTGLDGAGVAPLTAVNWICIADASSSCGATSGAGAIANKLVNLGVSGAVTFTFSGTVPPTATLGDFLVNTASVSPPAGVSDPNLANNIASDSDTVVGPVLSSISPTTGLRGTAVAVTLTGSDLTGATAVNVSGANVVVTGVTVVNSTTIAATFTVGTNAAVTNRNVTVVTPGGTTLSQPFTVLAPVLTSITPATGLRGTTVPVVFTGTNLAGATGVTVSGTGVTCTVGAATATTVNASCLVAIGAAVGTRNMALASVGNGSSNTLNAVFTVQAPTLTPIAPVTGLRGTTVPVVFTGTNLAGATGVTVSGAGVICTVGAVTATTVNANCAVGIGAAVEARNMSLTTAGNGSTNTLNAVFTVQAPVLATVIPATGVHNTTVTVTLTGTNLAGATGVTIAGGGVTCVLSASATATTVLANCAITNGATRSARTVTVNSATNGNSNTLNGAFTVN